MAQRDETFPINPDQFDRLGQEELKHRLREVELLNRVILAASSSLDPIQVLTSICLELTQAFHVHQAGVALLNPNGEFLTVVADVPGEGLPSAAGTIIPIRDNPATHYVLESHRPLAIRDTQSDPRMGSTHQLMMQSSIRSMLLVPIVIHDQAIGTLGLDSFSEHMFSDEEIELVQKSALVSSQALENVRLHRAVEEELRERRLAEAALRQSEERYRTLVENQGEGVAILDLQGMFIFTNPAAEGIFGVPRGSLTGRLLIEFMDAWQFGYLQHQLEQLQPNEHITQELDILRPDGERRNLILTFSSQVSELGEKTGAFGVFRDNTERKLVEEKLRYLSTHDILTGLYNRTFFDEELARLERGRAFPVSILSVDLDNLKGVNDHYGHAAGDELLRRTARLLLSVFRSEDVVARFGGDEFVVLLPSSDAQVADEAIQRIRASLAREGSSRPKHTLKLSIGAATGKKAEHFGSLLRRADRAMYQDKLSHLNR